MLFFKIYSKIEDVSLSLSCHCNNLVSILVVEYFNFYKSLTEYVYASNKEGKLEYILVISKLNYPTIHI